MHKTTRRNAESQIVALTGGRVIDGLGSQPNENWVILIQRGRILAVGPRIIVPDDAEVNDITGKTVLPGLIDMHGHLYGRLAGVMQNFSSAYPALYLAGGVTSVRSPGDLDPAGMYELKQRIADGKVVGPRLFNAGVYMEGKKGFHDWMIHSKTAKDIVQLIKKWKKRIDLVKFYAGISDGQMREGIKAAHAAGLPTAAHLGSITASRAIDLGIDSLEHGIHAMPDVYQNVPSTERKRMCTADLESREVKELIDKIVRNRVAIDPTIAIALMLDGEPDPAPAIPDWQDYFETPELATAVENEMAAFAERRNSGQDGEALRGREKALQFVKMVHEHGGRVLAGTDPFFPNPYLLPGWGLHAEIKYLTDAGLSPLAAIKAATSDAALVLGHERDFGSIVAGKYADLVVVEGNPAENIGALGNTVMVFKGGKQFDPETLRKSAKGKIGADAPKAKKSPRRSKVARA